MHSLDHSTRTKENIQQHNVRAPWGIKWRSSTWFVTFVVGWGINTDLIVYSVIVPVIPFRLQALGYKDVSSLLGGLLLAYSSVFALSTIPIAMFTDRNSSYRLPLIIGLFTLLCCEIMFMEAPKYWVMVLARIMQGMSSSVVWTSGLALLADTVPEHKFGKQIGLAMMGIALGTALGTPVGGALYARFGIRAPFMFAICCTIIDLVGRFLVVERKEAALWGVNVTGLVESQLESAVESNARPTPKPADEEKVDDITLLDRGNNDAASHREDALTERAECIVPTKPLSLLNVICKLCKSPRALVAMSAILTRGFNQDGRQTVIALHLQSIWGFNSAKVGLVLLVALVPTLVSSPLSGWMAGKYGTEWTVFAFLILDAPWWAVYNVESSLPLFIIAYGAETLFAAAVLSAVCVEMGAVSRHIPGIGYAHVYGAYNVAYGIGSSLGPIVAGQIYANARHGWMMLCILWMGMVLVCALLSVCFIGPRPLLARLLGRLRAGKV